MNVDSEKLDYYDTIYVCDFDPRTPRSLLTELFTQVAPVVRLRVPRDKVTREPAGYCFVTFGTASDAAYAVNVMNGVVLNGRALRIRPARGSEAL